MNNKFFYTALLYHISSSVVFHLWSVVCRLLSDIYGLSSMVYRLSSMVYGLSSMVRRLLSDVYGLSSMVRRLASHLRLYFLNRNRNVLHQINVAIFGDPKIIFYPNSHLFFFNINTWLDRK